MLTLQCVTARVPAGGTVAVNARERSDGFDSPGIDDSAGRDDSARVCSFKSPTLPQTGVSTLLKQSWDSLDIQIKLVKGM